MLKKIMAGMLCLMVAMLSSVAMAEEQRVETYGDCTVTIFTDDDGYSFVTDYEIEKEEDKPLLAIDSEAFTYDASYGRGDLAKIRILRADEITIIPMIGVKTYSDDKEDSVYRVVSANMDAFPQFGEREKVKTLVLPPSFERIESLAFQQCKNVTEVRFFKENGNRLHEIGKQAFINCTQLAVFPFPDTLRTIAEEAFLNCPSLKTVTIPTAVTEIGRHALGYTTENGYTYEKVDGFLIKGAKNSAAQTYAEGNGFPFEALDGTAAENWQGTGTESIDNFSVMPRATYTSGQFADVVEDAWYGANGQQTVKTAFELNIVAGKGDGIFDPEGNVLRCEALKMAAVVNSIYMGGNGKFIQKSWEKWYDPYVDYCMENGIITRADFSDGYETAATRAEMAHIFAHALPASAFADINAVTELPDVNRNTPYSDDIFALYRSGIVRGNDAYGTYTPNAPITRAAAAAIITRVALLNLRQQFVPEALPAEPTVGSYTPDMWVTSLEQLELLYKERVWGLYADMRVHMSEELAQTLWQDQSVYNTWVPMAADTNAVYNENQDNVMAYTFTNYSLPFELDALLYDETVAPRASAASKDYLAKIDACLAGLQLSAKSEREKLLAIHDWMVAAISYDTAYAESSYQFYGPLDTGKAVCQGYSELFYYLATRAGIRCATVSGMASSGAGMTDWGDHVWNVVYLSGDDTPYFIDVTYDDPVPDTTEGRHTYFMVTAETLAADHVWG